MVGLLKMIKSRYEEQFELVQLFQFLFFLFFFFTAEP